MSTLPNIILPATSADLFTQGPSAVFSDKPGEGGEQFDHLMARALSNPAGNKSPATGQNVNNRSADADDSPLGSTSLKFTSLTAYSPTPNTTAAANVNLFAGKAITDSQSSESNGQFDYLMTRAPWATAGDKSSVFSEEVNRSPSNVENFPRDSKGSTPAAPTSGVPLKNAAPAAKVNLVSGSTMAARSNQPIVGSDDLPVDSKPAAPISYPPATKEVTAATVNLISGNTTTPASSIPVTGNGQLNRLAARTSFTPTGDKSLVAGQNLSRSKVDADNPQVHSKNPTPGAQAATAAPAKTSLAANINLLPGDKMTAAANQARNSGGQFDHLITGPWLPPAAGKNPVASQNLNPGKTSAADGPIPIKDPKSVAQTSDSSHGHAVNSPDAAKNSTTQPEINQATVNPVNITAQILAPAGAVAALNVKTSSILQVAGKPAGTLPVLSRANEISASPTKTLSPVATQNQPAPEASSKIPNDNQKKDAPFNGLESYAKNNATDARTAALTGQTSATTNEEAMGDSKTFKPAAKTLDGPAPVGLPALAVSEPKISAPAQSIINGTPTAQQDELMSNGGKPTKTADLTGKFLPGSVAVVARGNDLPIRADQITATSAASTSAQNNQATATVSVASPIENVSTDDLRSQTLERTHDLVSVQALRLGDIGTGSSLQVVIKPGAGTQISLELRQHADGVEAQATLQQGDFKHLSQHWPELQQRLEQRGIRLAPLTDDGAFTKNSGGETFNQKQNPSGETMAEIALAAPVNGTFAQPAARGKAPTGWETWA